MKTVRRKTIKGKIKFVHRKERNSPALCANCKKQLHGVPRASVKLSKSEKIPNRPFGGNLCSNCSRQVLRERARGI
ncbi:MAG: 50S ribosomal protein L34e [Candidatus Aenigmarchaeota archaeon]|nr:50S ribosomal protein L34e [Candidatus Aenigmarchaeota archaeon]